VTIKSLYSFEVLSFFNFFFQWNKTINIFFRIFHSRNLPRIYGFKVFLDDLEVIRLINTIKSTMSVSFFFKSQQKKIADLSINFSLHLIFMQYHIGDAVTDRKFPPSPRAYQMTL
jgi:hypothetical protein